MFSAGRARLAAVVALLLMAALFATAFSQSITIPQAQTSPTDECLALFPSGAGAGAAQNLSGLFTPLAGIFQDSIGIALLALIVSFDVIGIGYMISKLVPSSNVGNWLSKEYWEVTKSAILIAVIFSVMTLMSSIGIMLVGSPASYGQAGTLSSNIQGLISGSESYLCTVNNNANVALDNIAPVILGMGFVQSIKVIYNGFPIPPVPDGALPVFRTGVTFNIWSSLLAKVSFIWLGQWLSLFIDFILYLIVPVKVIYTTQILLLPYLMAIGLGFLIPAGLIMRALPFVRGIGGTLIAFGIGFVIVWPGMMLLFNAPVSAAFCSLLSPNFCNTAVGPSPSTIIGPTGTSSPGSVCTENSAIAGTTLSSVCTTLVAYWDGIPNLFYDEFAVPWETIVSFYPAMNLLIQYSAYLIFQLFFLFVIDLMMFYAITDNIASMLGGSIKLQLGRKLKLV